MEVCVSGIDPPSFWYYEWKNSIPTSMASAEIVGIFGNTKPCASTFEWMPR